MEIKEIIHDFGQKLKTKYHNYNGIYLYGSRIKGTARIDSDYDIIIIFEKAVTNEIEKDILDMIYDYELKYEILIDYKIYLTEDFNDPTTIFRKKVKEEGVYYAP